MAKYTLVDSELELAGLLAPESDGDSHEKEHEQIGAFRDKGGLFLAIYSLSVRISAMIGSMTFLIWLVWILFPSELHHGALRYAQTINGTYAGTYNPTYKQYLFLGMPYAKPPVGDLRFRRPQEVRTSWKGIRDADKYGPHCIGYGDRLEPASQSEDCLTVNVVRPVQVSSSPLPVAVYVYGGGSHGGASSDGRYNMSFLTAFAADHDMPFIAVSFNYRASIWGFVGGREVWGSGNSNIGLYDQHMVLLWVHENIAAFGGDPKKVTLWGGSSGAENVGLHLAAHGGQDNGLFRAAIMQSGSPVTRLDDIEFTAQEAFDTLSEHIGCNRTIDSLDCLRQLPFENLNSAFMESPDGASPRMYVMSIPALDGDMVRTYGSLSLKTSQVVPVPILAGVVSNEGSTWIPGSISSWEDMRSYFIESRKYPEEIVDKILSMYPKIPGDESLGLLDPPIGSITDRSLWNRVEKVFGDIELNAAQRLMCQTYATLDTCYSFRYDALDSGAIDVREGVTHGAEIAPLFQNTDGIGFQRNPFEGKAEGYFDMSRQMGLMWAGFITQLDPNIAIESSQVRWPKYSLNRPENIVFNETGIRTEMDTYRAAAMSFINELQHGVLGK